MQYIKLLLLQCMFVLHLYERLVVVLVMMPSLFNLTQYLQLDLVHAFMASVSEFSSRMVGNLDCTSKSFKFFGSFGAS